MPHIPGGIENHGVLTGVRSTPFAGGFIPYVVRNPSGDWTPYLPAGERQSNNLIDTMACVSFSVLNCIETQEFFLTGQKVNYSDRWLAKISGTTMFGNYLVSVAEAIQMFGLVKEESWPKPANYTWESYYANPTPAQMAALVAEGKEWLRTHKFEAEFLSTDKATILKHLQQAPLQIVIPGHAIENFYTQEEAVSYFDSYGEPFKKQTTRSALSDVFKPLLTMKLMRLVNDNGTYFLVGDKGKIGLADMGVLNTIKMIETVEEVGSTTGTAQVGIFESGFTFHK